jgi:hypothetical protein
MAAPGPDRMLEALEALARGDISVEEADRRLEGSMPDPLDEVLRQVASGELSPEDAEPIIVALSAAQPGREPLPDAPAPRVAGPGSSARTAGRAVRIRVQEGGRTVVNLRIPMSWTGLTSLVPGWSNDQAQPVSEALRNGERGPILDIQDADGDGVVISTE